MDCLNIFISASQKVLKYDTSNCNKFEDLPPLYEYKIAYLHIFVSANQEKLINVEVQYQTAQAWDVTNQNVENVRTDLHWPRFLIMNIK